MSLAGDTTTIDLCKQNPKWFGGYVQGLNHAAIPIASIGVE